MSTISTVYLQSVFIDNLEYFRYPSRVEQGYYRTPLEPGYSVEIYDSAIDEFEFPRGSFWASAQASALIDRMVNDV